MVLGTSSDAGKSLTVAALCRILRQDGFDVAPFKAQNMALNSFATREGHEIGRAQAMQAEAAGVDPHVDMNPILLKPASDIGSQVILNGKTSGNYTGDDYYQMRPQLLEVVSTAYGRLANQHEIVVLEGAGSPVEMNLKDQDIVNMKMAEIANAVCVLVTDIDRGGVFASLVGTFALLESEERSRFCGFVVNKFRGDISRFSSGIRYLEERLSQTCLGVIPYLHDHGIDDEDSASLERRAARVPLNQKDSLSVCVIGLPYLSNFTDFIGLENLPGVRIYYTRRPEEARTADVLILPGSKNTTHDMLWLRENLWEPVIESHVAAGKPLAGICGGFQMLGREIRDPHQTESDVKSVPGLNLLDFTTVLGREKITRQATARLVRPLCSDKADVVQANPLFTGYEIHFGETLSNGGIRPLFRLRRLGDEESHYDGAVSTDGRIIGTYLHGLFDSVEGRALILKHWRKICGKQELIADTVAILIEREKRYDALAEHFRSNLKMDVIYRALNLQR